LIGAVGIKLPSNDQALRAKALKAQEGHDHLSVDESLGKVWVECVDFAAKAWKAIFTALTFRCETAHELWDPISIAFVEKYANLAVLDQAIPLLKYHLARPFALHNDQELPQCPDGFEGEKYIAGGWVCQLMKRITKVKNRKNFQICYDLLQAKHGMPRVPDSFVQSQLKKHQEVLSTPPKHQRSDETVGGTMLDDVCRFAWVLTKLLYKGNRLVREDLFGSCNAGFGVSRLKGGAFLSLAEDWLGSQFRHPGHGGAPVREIKLTTKQVVKIYDVSRVAPVGDLCDLLASTLGEPEGEKDESKEHEEQWAEALGPSLWSLLKDSEPPVKTGFETPAARYRALEQWTGLQKKLNHPSDQVQTKARLVFENFLGLDHPLVAEDREEDGPTEDPDLNRIIQSMGGPEAYQEALDKSILDVVLRSFERFVDEKAMCLSELDAKPFPICEPLKVRVITMGDEASYYTCLPIQKNLWGVLHNQEIFQWIGKPIDDESWAAHFSVTLKEDQKWVSGDYSAATDKLNRHLSETIWQAYCSATLLKEEGKETPLRQHWIYDLGLRALTGHKLTYPDGTVVQQANGQLMGSPLSFPVLCIANAAATYVGLHWWDIDFENVESMLGHAQELLKGPYAFNGDDCAFPATDLEYISWKKYTAACGLEFSVGKNYFSRDFLIMNSELRVQREDGWTFLNYLSLPLLWGMVDKGPESGRFVCEDCSPAELGPRCEELVRGCGGPTRDKLIRQFLQNYKGSLETIKKTVSSKVGWFTPAHLGGLGIPLPSDHKVEEWDLKVAAVISCLDPEKRLKVSLPTYPVFSVWDHYLTPIDRVFDEWFPKEPVLVEEDPTFPYGVSKTTQSNAEPSASIKLAMTLSLMLIERMGYSLCTRPGCNQEGVQEAPVSQVWDLLADKELREEHERSLRVRALRDWRRRITAVHRTASSTSLSPMELPNCLASKREFKWGRTAEVALVPCRLRV
jgi:hypothetical protein